MSDEEKEYRSNQIIGRYAIIAALVILFAVAIIGKATYISVGEGRYWRAWGEKTVRDSVLVAAVRGNIYASNGELMAISEPQYRLYIDFWAEGIKGDTLKKYVKPLSAELRKLFPSKSAGYYENHIMKGWNQRKSGKKKNREYRLLYQDINYSQWKAVQQMPYFNKGVNKTGLYTKEFKKRTNPYETLALRTIGSIYGEFDKGGKNGLELAYDSLLRGEPGLGSRRRVDGRSLTVIKNRPVDGKDIVSTIDIHTQDITETALLNKLRELDAESGTAVVMETATGEIKAITNMGRLREGEWGETKNYAVSDQSAPGSTFKVVSMMVALEDGLVKPNDPVDTGDGRWKIPGTSYVISDHNADRASHQSLITAEKSIRYSSNLGVAKLIMKAYSKNPGKYVDGIYKLGFYKDMHLEIPGSGHPVIHHPKDKNHYWSNSDLPAMSYGYATQMPPIYTLSFFNAIANNGTLVKPMFVREIKENGRTIEKKKPTVINEQLCSESTLKEIRIMLDSVVNAHDGTGKPAHSDKFLIAGKTGTARLESQGVASGYQVSFCGYFPSDNPQYSMIVVIRKPRNGNPGGGYMCGTVFKTIAEEIYARNIIHNKENFPVDTLHQAAPPVKRNFLAQTKTVPNTRGMGAKDAIFSMENVGLHAVVAGKGTVVSQSIPAGSKIVKGQTVKLQLQ
ncbi:MAG: transpeptidase family protein [Candidatus Symbiothrix sp.]|jgi:cell division protein FtsI (penicillin-binding protein 3)|nr:transpeptidase family protein [Candidatus Symbiothrix sp.]